MKQLYPDLWQTTLSMLGTQLKVYAYFLCRKEEENVLFYNTDQLQDLDKIEELGGIRYQYLSHHHERGASLPVIKNKFGSQLCCHSKSEQRIAKFCPVDIKFLERTTHADGIEVIPTPGHTDGCVCYTYQSPHGKKYLFTGDTIFQWNGRWATLPLTGDGGDIEDLVATLLLLKEVNPNVIICSGSIGDVSVVEATSEQWAQSIDQNISRLWKRKKKREHAKA